jgi:hypothetical protein
MISAHMFIDSILTDTAHQFSDIIISSDCNPSRDDTRIVGRCLDFKEPSKVDLTAAPFIVFNHELDERLDALVVACYQTIFLREVHLDIEFLFIVCYQIVLTFNSLTIIVQFIYLA